MTAPAQQQSIVKPVKTMIEFIGGQKEKFLDRIPRREGEVKEEAANRFVIGLTTAIQKSVANSKPGSSLADCDPNSVLLAAFEAAEADCPLHPSLGMGWLIKYGTQAQFQPSYKYYVQKAYETGDVKLFTAEVVYQSDTFQRHLAPRKILYHQPGNGERKRPTAIGAYALIEFMDGTIDYEYLDFEEIGRRRNCSKQPNSDKWTTFWESGWTISAIRKLAKRLPAKSRKLQQLSEIVSRYEERDDIEGNDAIHQAVPTEVRRVTDRVPEHKEEQQAQTQVEPETINIQPQKEPEIQPQVQTQVQEQTLTGDKDPYLLPADIKDFWDRSFAAGWKKDEVTKYLKQNHKVSEPKDLKKSQLASILSEIQSGGRQ